MAVLQAEQTVLSVFKEENAMLLMENNILRTDIGYWKVCHRQAVEREGALKKELQEKKARIKYLVRQLYEKRTEQSKKKTESDKRISGEPKRKRGQQPDRPTPKRRDQRHLPEKEEVYDLAESEKYCLTCGLPLKEMSDTEDSTSPGNTGSTWIPESDSTEKVHPRVRLPWEQRDRYSQRPGEAHALQPLRRLDMDSHSHS